jgi:hypothetical protein
MTSWSVTQIKSWSERLYIRRKLLWKHDTVSRKINGKIPLDYRQQNQTVACKLDLSTCCWKDGSLCGIRESRTSLLVANLTSNMLRSWWHDLHYSVGSYSKDNACLVVFIVDSRSHLGIVLQMFWFFVCSTFQRCSTQKSCWYAWWLCLVVEMVGDISQFKICVALFLISHVRFYPPFTLLLDVTLPLLFSELGKNRFTNSWRNRSAIVCCLECRIRKEEGSLAP